MTKVPDDERILEILRRGGYDISDEWAWVQHYLELADKCLNPDKTPPKEGSARTSGTGSNISNEQKQTAEPTDAADADDAEAATTKLNPLARKQSA